MAYTQTVPNYKNIHRKVGKLFGKPKECEHCGTTTALRYDWANVSGLYAIRRSDWVRLCRKCHMKFDAHLMVGKRFAGRQHSEATKAKIAESIREFWRKRKEVK